MEKLQQTNKKTDQDLQWKKKKDKQSYGWDL